MSQIMLIDAQHPEETRVVITRDGQVEEFDFITQSKAQIKSNIYLAKITRVEPSLQAAFVEYGNNKQGFLSFSEIHPDYYQIPLADRMRILEEERLAEEEAQARADAEADDEDVAGDEDGDGDAPSARASEEEGDGSRRGRRSRRRGRRRPREDREGRRDAAAETEVAGEHEEAAEGVAEVLEGEPTQETQAEPVVAEAETAEVQASEVVAEEVSVTDGEGEEAPAKPRRGRRPTKKRPAEMSSQDDELVRTAEVDEDEADAAEDEDQHALEAGEPLVVLEGGVLDGADDADDADEDGDELDADAEDAEDEEVETISGEETEETHSVTHTAFRRRYKIQEVIKRGQIVLVQVIKDERGNKGVSLTTYISLPGRYCVLMPNSPKGGGISRKIARGEDRKRLRAIASELKDSRGLSAIIRTAGIDRTQTEIQRDYEYLVKLWNQIRDTALSSTAPALVYEEGDIIKRSIRDHYSSEITQIAVQGDAAYHRAREFMELMMPEHTQRVKLHTQHTPIFAAYDVEAQLQSMHKPTARLRSGGYIVIDPTEALISIDVNSGRSTSERNVEETALKTNLEAAVQIARQLRLRDLGGLVVVDFIDMYYGKHRRMVERAFKDALKKDRAKIQVGHISPFGLLELSRQRLRPSIAETTSMACTHCGGSGRIRSRESLAIEIIRELEKDASSGSFSELILTVTVDQALHMFNHSRGYLARIEQDHGVKIAVRTDNNISGGSYTVDRIKLHGAQRQERDRDREREREPRPQREGRDRGRDRDRDRDRNRGEAQARDTQEAPVEAKQEKSLAVSATADAGTQEDAQERGGRRRRGSRGGRRRRSQERGAQAQDEQGTFDDHAEDAQEAPEREQQPRAARAVEAAPVVEMVAPAPAPAPKTPPVRTVPVIEAPEPAVIVTEEAPTQKKSSRGGWWRRIVE